MTWYIPPIYRVGHVVTGFVGYFYPIILYLSIFYQILQYILGIRFFIFELNFVKGNSIKHTALKMIEIMGGFFAAYLFSSMYR